MSTYTPAHRGFCAAVAVPLILGSAASSGTTAHAAPAPATKTSAPSAAGATATVQPGGGILKPSTRPSGLPASARGSHVRSIKVDVANDVNLLGVTWPNSRAAVTVFVRTTISGRTSGWQQLEKEAAGQPSRSLGTEPTLVTGRATVEAVTLANAPIGTSLNTYGSEVTPADAAQAASAAKAESVARSSVSMGSVSMNSVSMNSVSMNAGKGVGASASVSGQASRKVYRPAIKSRAQWRANQRLVTKPYSYARVTGVMLHHTATSNSYTRSQVPAILRGIQSYHVKGRGWNDIAYNVIVDKYGVAWEGRGGGLTNAVVGGHALGVTNSRVFGLSFLGNYQVKRPSSAMLDTAERVIAWKFALHNVRVYGQTSGSSGRLSAISGHRNEKSTECPGRYVYAKMAQIRAKTATYKQRYYHGLSPATVRAGSR